VEELTPTIRKQLELPADVRGVVVGNIDPGSPAAQQLEPGDVILSINREPLNTVANFNNVPNQERSVCNSQCGDDNEDEKRESPGLHLSLPENGRNRTKRATPKGCGP
jgi:hypothetical protein